MRRSGALALLLAPAVASAEPGDLTTYERHSVVESAAALHISGELDPSPGDKLIESVDIVVQDVFDEHDPVPDVLDIFHTTTRKHVIERELLFHPGEPYVPQRAEESARNLRTLRQLSLVVVVPLRGSAPDRVRVLVIVKDVWSLRLNWDVAISNNGLESLTLNLAEENLAGLHTTVGVLFLLDPGSYSLGAVATQRRLFGSDIRAALNGNVIFARDTGRAEGSFGTLNYGEPLLRTDQRWAWGTGVYWFSAPVRRYAQGNIATYDAPSTPGDDALPIIYHSERIYGGYELTRSFGRRDKYDTTLGVEVDRRAYRYTLPPGTSPSAERDFVDQWVPVADTRASPFAQLRTHGERYLHTSELETLGLQEEYRLGPEALLRGYVASSALGSTRDLVGVLAGLQMTFPIGNGLLRLLAENRVEVASESRNDAVLLAEARLATPRLGFGRLILNGVLNHLYENYLNRHLDLGGDRGLRGYPSAGFEGSFVGPLAMVLNTEFRTSSIDILSAQSGLAAFYDVGHVADSYADLAPKHSVGLGFRILFPQFDRRVLRLDWSFPLNPSPGQSTFPGAFFITFDQAFPMPDLETPSVMRHDL